ncbi:histone PARylation factor 1 [Anthonomus grandis grandis]|uniref:histone PARylation factor 1 n=1 Tax=Anthonomus grandis grandis TaxID=2921223 RepID=UPI0021662245|nr:histone PARylation factor 1 [Anthonomus grandis grandis]
MADNKTPITDREAYVKDPRIACKYGARCYQKNAVHHEKYKHPPPKRAKLNGDTTQPAKRLKMDVDNKTAGLPESTADQNEHLFTNKDNLSPQSSDQQEKLIPQENQEIKTESKQEGDTVEPQKEDPSTSDLGRTAKSFDVNTFIKQKFLVDMPKDFYQFWSFCKSLKEKCPQEALKDVGLTLVGPFDVLAGKFFDIPEQSEENYLIHWRYFRDPPEFQTVIRGDDRTGYHIGYYRDSPKDMPVFLASNHANTDGVFKVQGDNIFAAVYLYLEELKKIGDPFKKMHIGRFQGVIKKKAEELQFSLSEKSQKIRDRDKKVVVRPFSKIGVVVPYNRKTQVGYRELSISNKELTKLLTDIQKALPEQKPKLLSKLQNLLTNVSIATDECDFGTGIELGLDILAHGVDSINQTISRFLATNYRLMDREEFAKIAEAHMKNRKKGTQLSII